MIDLSRIYPLNTKEYHSGPIIYWMDRDIRITDNWALLYAQEKAKEHHTFVIIVYNLVENFLGGNKRSFEYKVSCLDFAYSTAKEYALPFFVINDTKNGQESAQKLLTFLKEHNAGMIITDFSPLTISRNWKNELKKVLEIPFTCVDSHNIVPWNIASDKREFAAYTLRPKLHKKIQLYLTEFPKIELQSTPKDYLQNSPLFKKENIQKSELWQHPQKMLDHFLEHKESYNDRNNPNKLGQSKLSPALHFGTICSQTVILALLKKANLPLDSIQSLLLDKENPLSQFIEEIFVRKELADNFCWHAPDYENISCFPDWTKKTQEIHKQDIRDFLYTQETFEQAKTHDTLWNAAQNQLLKTGKMHGFMRMYWAKKILEWTKNPQEALTIAIYLNDTYSIDGRDPNGYTGICWSIGGVHDRAWFDRSVFGQVRYMNANGCKAKFNVLEYCEKWK
jgi:deoxyribodipyrimidine photo-lyase